MGSIHPETEELRQGVLRWRQNAPPEEKAEIDQIVARKDVVIHVIQRSLPAQNAVGASGPASKKPQRVLCGRHPDVKGVPTNQDWDVIIDPEHAKSAEERSGIPYPLEPSLQHEIMGHFAPTLRDPTLLDSIYRNPMLFYENQRGAVEEENRYRRHAGLPVVPPAPRPPSRR